MNHIEHLYALISNPLACEEDAERAIRHMSDKFRAGYGRGKKKIALQLATMLFESQGRVPLSWTIVDNYPMAWNGPIRKQDVKGFDLNYIRYESGHDLSINEGGTVTPFNMVFESEQCNRCHGALSIATWIKYVSNKEVTERYNNILKLRSSDEYNSLVQQLKERK